MTVLPLSTARLTLRRMRSDDAATLAAYRNDPDVARFQDWATPYPLEDAHALIAGQEHLADVTAGEWLQIAIERDREMIGDVAVGLDAAGCVATIGYTLSPGAQGLGYATEAVGAVVDHLFAHLAVHRIVAGLDPRNHASMRVIEPLGFRHEGVARRAELIRGEWLDDLRFALLREDRQAWLARPRTPAVEVTLEEVTTATLRAVLALATFEFQRQFVAPMAKSLAEALVPPEQNELTVVPWFRAIVADGEVAGFLMMAAPTEFDPHPFLWRLLVDRAHQHRGIGERAVALLVDHLRHGGHRHLLVSWEEGPGGPRPFYERLGFVPTGEIEDGETIARLELDPPPPRA